MPAACSRSTRMYRPRTRLSPSPVRPCPLGPILPALHRTRTLSMGPKNVPSHTPRPRRSSARSCESCATTCTKPPAKANLYPALEARPHYIPPLPLPLLHPYPILCPPRPRTSSPPQYTHPSYRRHDRDTPPDPSSQRANRLCVPSMAGRHRMSRSFRLCMTLRGWVVRPEISSCVCLHTCCCFELCCMPWTFWDDAVGGGEFVQLVRAGPGGALCRASKSPLRPRGA